MVVLDKVTVEPGHLGECLPVVALGEEAAIVAEHPGLDDHHPVEGGRFGL
jgi:hypothetical protein